MTDITHAFYECVLREIERLRAEIKIWVASFEQAASGHATYAEKTEQLLAENERLRAEVERLRTDLMESNEIRAALGEENSDD